MTRKLIIAGMAGSGTAVSFNAARWTCDQILGIDGDNDYPAEYFSPTRLLNPDQHRWPKIELDSQFANEAVAGGGKKDKPAMYAWRRSVCGALRSIS